MKFDVFNGYTVDIDDNDYKLIKDYKWSYDGRYARACIYLGNYKSKTILMHRLIMNQPKNCVDHIDGNGLNNSRSNLRLCTRAENNRNRSKSHVLNTTGFTGVSFNKKANKFESYVSVNNIRYYLGLFLTAKDASLARDKKAREVHGQFFSPSKKDY